MNDATRFELDERQRAMLAEMGVRVWLPAAAPPETAAEAPASEPATAQPAPVMTPPRTVPSAVPAAVEPPRAAPPAPVRLTSPVAAPAAIPLAVTGARPAGVEQMDWPALEAAVAGCQACDLCQSRQHTVFGVGDRQARWMVVGEAPGEQEDRQGEPFVGPAGQLLDNMLRAIGLDRAAEGPEHGVFIANVLKCRPPSNRNPQPEEMAQCEPYLRRQVALVRPKIILAMGRFAVQSLLRTSEPIGKLRGRVHHYEGVPVIVTYHPAYLLRNQPDKAKAWADLCLALQVMQQPG